MTFISYFAVYVFLTPTLLVSCYFVDDVKTAANVVVDDIKLTEGKVSDALQYASRAVVDEFKLSEDKTSDIAKYASDAVVDEFNLIERKTADALKYASDDVIRAFQQIELKSYGCQCAHYSCGCCAHLDFPKIHLNDTGCVNLTYLPEDYGLSFTMTIDNITIYNETISVHNPPPICFDVPYLEKYAELCLHFYDIDATKRKLHGCLDIEARLYKVMVGHYRVGCFNIGKSELGLWQKYHLLLIEKIRSEQKKLSENVLG